VSRLRLPEMCSGSSDEAALIGAGVGAGSALIAQWLAHHWSGKRDRLNWSPVLEAVQTAEDGGVGRHLQQPG
jgi:hypothetical protein